VHILIFEGPGDVIDLTARLKSALAADDNLSARFLLHFLLRVATWPKDGAHKVVSRILLHWNKDFLFVFDVSHGHRDGSEGLQFSELLHERHTLLFEAAAKPHSTCVGTLREKEKGSILK